MTEKRGIPANPARALLALGALIVLAGPAHAQPTTVVARAAGVTGHAMLSNANGSPPFALASGSTLNPGDRIDTHGGGRVVIGLSDGSMVVIEPESVVVVKDFRAASSLRELLEITLGMVRITINHLGGRPNPYRMNSPTASIAVRGTEFSIEVAPPGDTRVVVFDGVVEVTSLADPRLSTLLEAGRGVLVRAGQEFWLFAAPPGRDIARQDPATGRDASSQPSLVQEDRDESPRATANTYDRYIAGLASMSRLPFLFRFNAFAEPHLDSLENPAYATAFPSGEGRVFVLPSFHRGQGFGQGDPASAGGGTSPGGYSVFPQFSLFTPVGNSQFAVGGSLVTARVGTNSLTATPDFDPTALGLVNNGLLRTSGSSTSNFYSASLVGARRAGLNSFGLELEALRGTGSMNAATTDSDVPGQTSIERIVSSSDVLQTRMTAGYSRSISGSTTLGVFYRYAFIHADDGDLSHTLNDRPRSLNSTASRGHSSEIGVRLRGAITPRLFYGVAGAWLGVSLNDALARTTTAYSGQRDRARRGSMAMGLGYLLTPRTVLTFDLAGGLAHTAAVRTESATGNLLQSDTATDRVLSFHAAVQREFGRHLFVSASLLSMWRSNTLVTGLYPDLSGNMVPVEDAAFPFTPGPDRSARRRSDFGAGWRLSPNLFAQYVYSTGYDSGACHMVMLRYRFSLRPERAAASLR